MQRIQRLSIPQKILAFAVAVVLILAVAAIVGATAAFVSESGGSFPRGKDQQRAAGESPSERGSEQGNAADENAADESPENESTVDESPAKESTAKEKAAEEYVGKVADLQDESVEAALESNGKLLQYDRLTAGDVEEMRTNRAVLMTSSDRAEGLDSPEKYGAQHAVFVRAIDELRDANELAHRLVADPTSTSQADFEAYDRHLEKATTYLRRSNEMLGADYKTTEAAQNISFG
jgi:hypothetical protein